MTKRRLIALGLSAVMAVSLAACGSKPAEAPVEEAPAEEGVEEAPEVVEEEPAEVEVVEEEPVEEEAKANLVYATSTFG